MRGGKPSPSPLQGVKPPPPAFENAARPTALTSATPFYPVMYRILRLPRPPALYTELTRRRSDQPSFSRRPTVRVTRCIQKCKSTVPTFFQQTSRKQEDLPRNNWFRKLVSLRREIDRASNAGLASHFLFFLPAFIYIFIHHNGSENKKSK